MKYHYSLVELKVFTSAGCEAGASHCFFFYFVGFCLFCLFCMLETDPEAWGGFMIHTRSITELHFQPLFSSYFRSDFCSWVLLCSHIISEAGPIMPIDSWGSHPQSPLVTRVHRVRAWPSQSQQTTLCQPSSAQPIKEPGNREKQRKIYSMWPHWEGEGIKRSSDFHPQLYLWGSKA